jgi:hypothetical protein
LRRSPNDGFKAGHFQRDYWNPAGESPGHFERD